MGKWYDTKWFDFEDGSNPYGVWGDRMDEFFRMVVAWQPSVIGVNSFKCPKEPTEAYYHSVDYQFKKSALRDFAIEWQSEISNFNISYEDLAWYEEFFTKYGKRYGLLREFHENGIC